MSVFTDPSLYEGDIELTKEQKALLNSYAATKKGLYNHWPLGEPIPYEIDEAFRKYINAFRSKFILQSNSVNKFIQRRFAK